MVATRVARGHLHRVLVHIIAETARHVGHAGILRELIDREVGVRADNNNVPEHDVAWWGDYVETLQRAARGGRTRLRWLPLFRVAPSA